MSASDAERFWRFSLCLYALPDVQDDCLRLQDEGGLNVNLALWCCWRALEGETLGENDIRAARERIAEWNRTVTGPLRTLRRRVKAEFCDELSLSHMLYEHLKTTELEAERVEQALLCPMAQKSPAPQGTKEPRHLVGANLETYMGISGISGKSPLRADIPGRFARQISAMSEKF